MVITLGKKSKSGLSYASGSSSSSSGTSGSGAGSSSGGGGGSSSQKQVLPTVNPVTGNPYGNTGSSSFTPKNLQPTLSVSGGRGGSATAASYQARALSVAGGNVTPREQRLGITESASTIRDYNINVSPKNLVTTPYGQAIGGKDREYQLTPRSQTPQVTISQNALDRLKNDMSTYNTPITSVQTERLLVERAETPFTAQPTATPDPSFVGPPRPTTLGGLSIQDRTGVIAPTTATGATTPVNSPVNYVVPGTSIRTYGSINADTRSNPTTLQKYTDLTAGFQEGMISRADEYAYKSNMLQASGQSGSAAKYAVGALALNIITSPYRLTKGVIQAGSNPSQTAEGIANAISNPGETARSIGQDALLNPTRFTADTIVQAGLGYGVGKAIERVLQPQIMGRLTVGEGVQKALPGDLVFDTNQFSSTIKTQNKLQQTVAGLKDSNPLKARLTKILGETTTYNVEGTAVGGTRPGLNENEFLRNSGFDYRITKGEKQIGTGQGTYKGKGLIIDNGDKTLETGAYQAENKIKRLLGEKTTQTTGERASVTKILIETPEGLRTYRGVNAATESGKPTSAGLTRTQELYKVSTPTEEITSYQFGDLAVGGKQGLNKLNQAFEDSRPFKFNSESNLPDNAPTNRLNRPSKPIYSSEELGSARGSEGANLPDNAPTNRLNRPSKPIYSSEELGSARGSEGATGQRTITEQVTKKITKAPTNAGVESALSSAEQTIKFSAVPSTVNTVTAIGAIVGFNQPETRQASRLGQTPFSGVRELQNSRQQSGLVAGLSQSQKPGTRPITGLEVGQMPATDTDQAISQIIGVTSQTIQRSKQTADTQQITQTTTPTVPFFALPPLLAYQGGGTPSGGGGGYNPGGEYGSGGSYLNKGARTFKIRDYYKEVFGNAAERASYGPKAQMRRGNPTTDLARVSTMLSLTKQPQKSQPKSGSNTRSKINQMLGV